MYKILIIMLTLFAVGCARTGNIATPNPDEVSEITYNLNTDQNMRTWHFVNDDLTLRYSERDLNGRLISSNVRKVSPNDFNWLVTQFEDINYTKLQTRSKVVNSGFIGSQRSAAVAPETISIENLGGTYTFQKKGNIRFPPQLEKITQQIPTVFR
ncbi:hypothetical protein [Leucothrix pacifica]|uniref:LPS export ABC transporter periplasmic protein LptC n=1 Tax=Leucothrix pacifica TaxID=1247513 RepID=A0A317C7H7_9GAMM|nr:hypothetical protein [Leucothrix pacifica]PWQ92032.1 hypothetical protein DKW60_23325 [Leucothrix pacifica]